MPEHWQPNVDLEFLLLRSQLLEKVRCFMQERNILEVDTPILSPASIPDPNIHSLSTNLSMQASPQSVYLSTSPEFFMKRLLASGSGAIYQITKVFRDDEPGRLHQAEFSMLEWYQPAYDHQMLMEDVSELLLLLGLSEAEKCTYESVFLRYLYINPIVHPYQSHKGWLRMRDCRGSQMTAHSCWSFYSVILFPLDSDWRNRLCFTITLPVRRHWRE